MSRLEERCKPIIKKILDGKDRELRADELQLLARWADKTAMAQEVGDLLDVVSTPSQRRTFIGSDQPDSYSEVYLGTFEDSGGPLRRRHYRYTDGSHLGVRATSRCTSFVIGSIVLVVWGYSVDRPSGFVYNVEGTEMAPYLHRIWPQPESLLKWPLKQMNYRQFFFLTELYYLEVELARLHDVRPPALMAPAQWAAIKRNELMRLIPGVGFV